MAIYMPPLCRKKKVLERYNPDTFRVISKFAEDEHLKHDFEEANKPSEWRRIWLENQGLALPDIYNRKTEVLPKAVPDYRINRPHPGSCGFLRNNVRLLNEPICSVYTEITRDEQSQWWPSRVSNEPLQVPPRTNDTIYRGDFTEQERSAGSAFGSLRHTSNPNKEPALGTVPVNFLRPKSGKQRLFKEKMSYEHQYNSRSNPNYPIRGKRHGSFVWDQMSRENTKKFIDHYSVITPEEGVHRQEVMEAEKLADEAAKLLEDTNFTEPAPVEVKPVSTESQEPGGTANKVSPVHSGPTSPKNSGSRKNSGQKSPKKVLSRKPSASDGNNSNEKVEANNSNERIKANGTTENVGLVEKESKDGPTIGEESKEE